MREVEVEALGYRERVSGWVFEELGGERLGEGEIYLIWVLVRVGIR